MNPAPIGTYKDFTVKARLAHSGPVIKSLERLNASFVGLDQQTDRYFKTEKGKLKLRQGNIENLITHYERVRDDAGERTIVYRYDLNPTRDQTNELISSHEQLATVVKERRIYKIKNVKVHVDRLTNGDEFLEIEAIDRGNQYSIQELKDQCFALLSALGISAHELIPTGYAGS